MAQHSTIEETATLDSLLIADGVFRAKEEARLAGRAQPYFGNIVLVELPDDMKKAITADVESKHAKLLELEAVRVKRAKDQVKPKETKR